MSSAHLPSEATTHLSPQSLGQDTLVIQELQRALKQLVLALLLLSENKQRLLLDFGYFCSFISNDTSSQRHTWRSEFLMAQ